VYLTELDWLNAVADEVYRACGTRPTFESLLGDEPDDVDAGYDADAREAARRGVSLADVLAFRADMAGDPWGDDGAE
jgi:hypothetical protein